MDLSKMSDAQLLQHSDWDAACAVICRRHWAKLLRVVHCYRRQDDIDHEGIVQDAFGKLHSEHVKSMSRGQSIENLPAWLRAVVLYGARKACRKLGPPEPVLREVQAVARHRTQPSPSTQVFKDEAARKLRECIGRLPPAQRAVAELKAEGMSEIEIAGVLGITVTNVTNRLFRARENLRECLGRYVQG